MKHFGRTVVCIAVCFAMWAGDDANAQNVATGSLTGVVKDTQSGVLPGTTVSAVHQPTGTSYQAVTEGDGIFNILNVRVGGPCTVTITLAGLRPFTQSGLW